jgi:Fe2+ transport system protein FeoA
MVTQMKSLMSLKPGQKGKLAGYSGKTKIGRVLNQYGIFEGDVLEVLRTAPFDGPILLRINDREIAISLELADFLLVEISE